MLPLLPEVKEITDGVASTSEEVVFVFIAITLLVTEVLQGRIFFSLFVGIPAGFIAGIIVLALLTVRQKSGKQDIANWGGSIFFRVMVE